MRENWNRKHFETMQKIFPPARPSISEMNEYKREIHKLKSKLKRKLDILILGTTIEFINLALEENMNITIIDFSEEYHNKVFNKLKVKYLMPNVKIVISKWEEMPFDNEFDVIIGDCVIGNVEKPRLEEFIIKVSKSLRNYGLFLGKNFLIPKEYSKKNLEDIVKKYNRSYSYYNPFTYMMFDLAVLFLENDTINFKEIYNGLEELNKKNMLSAEIMKYFIGIKELGEINCKFYMPTIDEYESMINRYLNIRSVKYGKDIYSKNFPLYIIEKNDKKEVK